MRLHRLIAMPVAATFCALAPSLTASAATAAAGTLDFAGTVTYSTSPCTTSCTGALDAATSGHLEGVAGTVPFDVTWVSGASRLRAGFSYSDTDCTANSESASGHGGVSLGAGEVTGNWWIPGEAFPRAVLRMSMDFDVQWTRTAGAATISLRPVSIVFDVAGLGSETVLTTPQQGAMLFASLPNTACTAPASNTAVTVAASIPVAGAA